MDDLDQRFTSRVAPIWDFETTHPDAPTEDRLKACLMRESISKPYVEAQAKALERERKAARVLRELMERECYCHQLHLNYGGLCEFCSVMVEADKILKGEK